MADQHSANMTETVDDFDLHGAVLARLEEDTIVRESRLDLSITVEEGVATVVGCVPTNILRDRVLYDVATTTGIRKVIDGLHTDRAIEVAVAGALAGIEGMAAEMHSYRGVVTLHGTIGSEDQREDIITTAAAVEGVQRIVDQLSVR